MVRFALSQPYPDSFVLLMLLLVLYLQHPYASKWGCIGSKCCRQNRQQH